jgi:hypothetical protein
MDIRSIDGDSMSKPPASRPHDNAAEPKSPKPDAGPGTDRDTAREKTAQNDRAAKNQSGLGSNPSARDVTSGRHPGNQ